MVAILRSLQGAQLTRVEKKYGLSTGEYTGCVHLAAKSGDDDRSGGCCTDGHDHAAFAEAGNKDAKRTEAHQKASGENEGSAEGDAEETLENPFDGDIQGVEDDTATSPSISTPTNRNPASIWPIDTDTDEEMGIHKQARVSVGFTSPSLPDLQLILYPLDQLHTTFVV